MTPLLREIERRQTTLEIERIAVRGSIKRYPRPTWWRRFLKGGRRLTK